MKRKNIIATVFMMMIFFVSYSWANLTLDAQGWTKAIAPIGAKTIYVSSSTGDDCAQATTSPRCLCRVSKSCGYTEETAVKTLKAGFLLLRNNEADQILFKRGDVFTEGDQVSTSDFIRLKKSGPADDNPNDSMMSSALVIGTYGDLSLPRPLFKTGNQIGFHIDVGGGTPSVMQNILLQGIHFVAHTRDPRPGNSEFKINQGQPGVKIIYLGRNIKIEDCKFEFYNIGILTQGSPTKSEYRLKNITVRRNVVVDSYNGLSIGDSGNNDTNHNSDGDKKSQGMYTDAIDGLFIEENIFDRNGWYPNIGGILKDNARSTMYNHNLYLNHSNTGVKLKGNIIMRASSHGAQVRSGGVANDNVFIANSIALLMGYDSDTSKSEYATVHNNIILDGKDIVSELPRGWGLHLNKNLPGASVKSNIVANVKTPSPNRYSYKIYGKGPVTISHNIIWNWPGGNTAFNSSKGPFSDSTASIEKYNSTQGRPASFDDFAEVLRNQRQGNWNEKYTASKIGDYFRSAFNIPAEK